MAARVFESVAPDYIRWRMTNMPNFSIHYSLYDSRPIAFKAGYAFTQSKYYSWLGGVDPDFRRRGVASALTKRQHAWLVESGYSSVESAVNQENHAMAQVNLQNGYDVCGSRTEPHRVQDIYTKMLR